MSTRETVRDSCDADGFQVTLKDNTANSINTRRCYCCCCCCCCRRISWCRIKRTVHTHQQASKKTPLITGSNISQLRINRITDWSVDQRALVFPDHVLLPNPGRYLECPARETFWQSASNRETRRRGTDRNSIRSTFYCASCITCTIRCKKNI